MCVCVCTVCPSPSESLSPQSCPAGGPYQACFPSCLSAHYTLTHLQPGLVDGLANKQVPDTQGRPVYAHLHTQSPAQMPHSEQWSL